MLFFKLIRRFAARLRPGGDFARRVEPTTRRAANLKYSILASSAGYGFRQYRVDLIQHLALIGTLWEGLLVDAFFAGAFHQIADFEIVFKFKYFFWHYSIFQQVKI